MIALIAAICIALITGLGTQLGRLLGIASNYVTNAGATRPSGGNDGIDR